MTSADNIVAIRRHGRMACKQCLFDSHELAVWETPAETTRLAEEMDIGIVRAGDLKGGERCGRCGQKIKAE